mmetsp:Transcript_18446/g.50644  ORF Transcript_18446/g.50644 Transcript_18446/m.50644 type:complete len:796 (+) Transcript_18446:108-2495(+)
MARNTTREVASKNNVMVARAAVKRYPEHKELVRRFVSTFEKKDGPPDPKFGFQKYKALLRKAVNRHIDTIFIDIDDVAEYCQQELAHDDAGPSPAPKIQMQDAINTLTQDIENNALRYSKFFYEALDMERPERDEGRNPENADLSRDLIQQWLGQALQRQRESGRSGGEIPIQMRNPYNVRFKPRDDTVALKFREITAKSVGALVQLDCLVVRCSEVKPRIEVVTYQCEMCESEIFLTVEGSMYNPPRECPGQKCRERKQPGKLRCHNRMSKFGKYQEMRVQELSEHVPVGGVPRAINAVLSADLCRQCSPGDAITLSGVYTPYELPYYVARQKGTSQEMFIDGHWIKKHKRGYNEQGTDDDEISRRVDEEWKKGNIYETVAKSIAPEIFGHVDVKKAMLLSLIGGFTKTMKDGLKIRGEIHTLFMGDPGVAKSQLMKQVCNIAPRSVYTTGKGTSGVGLTATVVRDKATGEVSLEGGALVLADMGICCIDEFDKMDESDRTAIHEVMEQQSVSIAKSGITTTLNTRTTIIAAANPVFGRYNIEKSAVENIDLPPALLSRFDLIFLLLDKVDPEKDALLARHVLKVHANYGQKEAQDVARNAEAGGENSGDALNLGFVPYDAIFMRNFVKRAKSYEPYVDDQLQKDIVDAYVSMRDDEKRGGVDSRKSYTTPRTLLAILRLSQAHARARFSNRVERQDFEEAMRITKASKESVELASAANRNANPMEMVYDTVSDLSRSTESNEGWVEMAKVISMAGHKGLAADIVLDAIEQWEGLSVLCQNPEKTMVRFLVPAE